ncbi:recombinase family protein [Undibacterium jejuense]|uniref:Recombinase family protein n=1 Tax=Undibacterium jejuense TaxID=1344949 RepID=A0A923HHP2_9BURK|nr:recombinase family protein [Undibacterium jejuense]MBC3860944.1 recombinase family protein [Undibacterium jejuense]
MTINTRIYLRASTSDQDASRAEASLNEFATTHKLNVVHTFTENESGASLDRPELFKLIAASKEGDILLCESTDRLTRLTHGKWEVLKQAINEKGIRLVMLDLPTSHMNLNIGDDVTSSIMKAINNMIIDIMAAMARKDYEQRRERIAQGRAKAKAQGKLVGRKVNTVTNDKAVKLLQGGNHSWNEIVELCGISRAQVAKLAKSLKTEE